MITDTMCVYVCIQCPRTFLLSRTIRAKLRVACWLAAENKSIDIRSETAMAYIWMCVCFYKRQETHCTERPHVLSFVFSFLIPSHPPKKKWLLSEIWPLWKNKNWNFVTVLTIPSLITKTALFSLLKFIYIECLGSIVLCVFFERFFRFFFLFFFVVVFYQFFFVT